MSGDYTSKSYRKARWQFREDCRRNRRGCSICHQAIDYNLKFPHPWAWELHHVQPSSTHPHLHTVSSNHAPSHARCNKSHGNAPAPTPDAWVQPTW